MVGHLLHGHLQQLCSHSVTWASLAISISKPKLTLFKTKVYKQKTMNYLHQSWGFSLYYYTTSFGYKIPSKRPGNLRESTYKTLITNGRPHSQGHNHRRNDQQKGPSLQKPKAKVSKRKQPAGVSFKPSNLPQNIIEQSEAYNALQRELKAPTINLFVSDDEGEMHT